MQMARIALGDAWHARETITEVAMRHGFPELGRFSVAYRALFGESPSATLRRSDRTRKCVLDSGCLLRRRQRPAAS
jgi:AraC-like DNA-binding protein